MNRRKREGFTLSAEQEGELAELDAEAARKATDPEQLELDDQGGGDPPAGDPPPSSPPTSSPPPSSPPTTSSPPAGDPPPSSPPTSSPPPVKVAPPPPRPNEPPPPVDRPKGRGPSEEGDGWLARYDTKLGNGREFVCHTVGGIAHKMVAGWQDELKAAGIEPLIDVRTPEMEAVYVVAAHHLLPPDWKLTPEIIVAASATSMMGQRVYHNRAIIERKNREAMAKPEPRRAPEPPPQTSGDERAPADHVPPPQVAAAPPAAPSSPPAPSSPVAPKVPDMQGFVG